MLKYVIEVRHYVLVGYHPGSLNAVQPYLAHVTIIRIALESMMNFRNIVRKYRALLLVLAVVLTAALSIGCSSSAMGAPAAATAATSIAKPPAANPAQDPVFAAIMAANANDGLFAAGNPHTTVASGDVSIPLNGARIGGHYDEAIMSYSDGSEFKVQLDGEFGSTDQIIDPTAVVYSTLYAKAPTQPSKVDAVQHRAFYYAGCQAYGSNLKTVTLIVWTEWDQLVTVTITSPTASIQQALVAVQKMTVYLMGN